MLKNKERLPNQAAHKTWSGHTELHKKPNR